MANDTTTRVPADPTRINLQDNDEILYWSQKFGVTNEQLIAAVRSAGVMANDVALALKPK